MVVCILCFKKDVICAAMVQSGYGLCTVDHAVFGNECAFSNANGAKGPAIKVFGSFDQFHSYDPPLLAFIA